MSRGQVAALERLLLAVGLTLLVLGVGAYDWRAGLILAGIILVGLTAEWSDWTVRR